MKPRLRRTLIVSLAWEDWLAWVNAPVGGARVELPEWPDARVIRTSDIPDFARNRISLLLESPTLPEVDPACFRTAVDLEAILGVDADGRAYIRFVRATKTGGNGGADGRAAD